MTTAISAVREPRVGEVLRRAARDFYEESWRLVLLNTLLSVYVLLVLAATTFVPPALLLQLGAGWPAAALVSAAVIVVETGSLTFVEVAESAWRSWRRGVVLAGVLAAAVVATLISFRFYGDAGTLAWPLAVVVLYLGAVFLLYQLLLWPLAMRDHDRPLGDVAVDAALVLLRRPFAVLVLGLALLIVNVAGLVLAVLPFLTMTIAYSTLAAARFALAPVRPGEV
jgi:hypothetical protein